MPADADTDKREKGFVSQCAFWVAVGFVVVGIYVLSVGPVGRLILMSTDGRFFSYFYRPVMLSCNRSECAFEMTRRYLAVWDIDVIPDGWATNRHTLFLFPAFPKGK
jgi:hypothetical protein